MIKEFVKLIDKRDELIKDHFGDNMREMLNFYGEREWYAKNITKLDRKIMLIAKQILPNETFRHIADVYANEFLLSKYQEFKKEIAFEK